MYKFSSWQVLLITFLLTLFLAPLAFGSNLDPTSDNFRIPVSALNPISSGSPPWGVDAFLAILGNISDILLFSIPLIGWLLIIAAGYFYIFSGGDSERISTAKKIMKYNIIAMVIAFFSYSIVRIIASFFN